MNINKLITPIDIRKTNFTEEIYPTEYCDPEPVRELEDNYREAIRLLNRIQKVVNGRGDNVTKVGKVKDLLI